MVDDAPTLSSQMLAVLLVLADDDRHGYAIMQEVDAATDGRVQLLPGSLYTTIRRLLDAGLVSAAGREGRRQLYSLTPAGRRAAEAEVARLGSLVRLGRLTLGTAPQATGAES